MRFIGIDLHKRSMTVCVIDRVTGETFLKTLPTSQPDDIRAFFQGLVKFQAVMEATATYEWLWELLEPLAERIVLAHPKKVKVISESMRKSDKRDAYFLAWLLSQDAVPEAHRPTPRQRAYQQLVRHRVFLVRERTKVLVKVKNYFAARNINHGGLFRAVDPRKLATKLPPAECLCVQALVELHEKLQELIEKSEKELTKFRKAAPAAEKKAHDIVCSVPGVGYVTADVVLSTIGTVDRFPSVRKIASYSGLIPGLRTSDKTRKELPITKEGPRILRWALVEAAWRCIRTSRYWEDQFERIARRRGRKKAIVAVARRLIGVIFALLKKGESYRERLLDLRRWRAVVCSRSKVRTAAAVSGTG